MSINNEGSAKNPEAECSIMKDSEFERRAADLWRADNPTRSVFDCDWETKERYRALARSASEPANDGWEFAIVEVMGFRKHAGRCREVERFGVKLIRVDIPIKGDPIANGWETHYYPGSSLFSYTPTDGDSVMRANKPYEPASRYRLPAPAVEEHEFSGVEEAEANLGGDEPELLIEEPPPAPRPRHPDDEEPF